MLSKLFPEVTIRLSRCKCILHFSQVKSPWEGETVANHQPWMDTAWQLTFEMPQETPPIHETNYGPWPYEDGSIWRIGPRRMTPLICFQELLLFLWGNNFGMLAGHLEEEVLNRGLFVIAGENGQPDRFVAGQQL